MLVYNSLYILTYLPITYSGMFDLPNKDVIDVSSNDLRRTSANIRPVGCLFLANIKPKVVSKISNCPLRGSNKTFSKLDLVKY